MFAMLQSIAAVDAGELLRHFGVDWHILIVQSLNFVVVAWLLYKFAFGRVMRTMDERREKIESGLAYADRMRLEIADFESSRGERIAAVSREAEDILQSAKNDARAIVDSGKLESSGIASSMISSAEREIAKREEKMLSDARAEIGSLVADIAMGVLDGNMTAADRAKYVASAEKMLLSERL
jgi:F-type H+-transporting ATPase subunit b